MLEDIKKDIEVSVEYKPYKSDYNCKSRNNYPWAKIACKDNGCGLISMQRWPYLETIDGQKAGLIPTLFEDISEWLIYGGMAPFGSGYGKLHIDLYPNSECQYSSLQVARSPNVKFENGPDICQKQLIDEKWNKFMSKDWL